MKLVTLKAAALLTGTIIGVGIFGIPFVAMQSGFFLSLLYLLTLGIITMAVHLFYAEVVAVTPGSHRFLGHVDYYFSVHIKKFVSLNTLFVRLGALLAYIIVSGEFLKALFGGNSFFWSLVFFSLGAWFILLGIKSVANLELWLALLLILSLVIIFIFGFPHIDLANFFLLQAGSPFLPYGVILFALGGLAAIPEMGELLKKDKKELRLAVGLGTAIPIIVFIVFVFLTVGISGAMTTPEALTGLQKILAPKVMAVAFWFGILALFTSFLSIGLNAKHIFYQDYKLKPFLAWVLACFIPLIFFILGTADFIGVIGVVGSVFGGLEAIMAVWLFLKLKPRLYILPYLTIIIFSLGIILEIITKFGKVV